MCATPLITQVVNDDGILRAACLACGWIHFPTNGMGVNLVIRAPGGIAAVLPPGEPDDAPAALPGRQSGDFSPRSFSGDQPKPEGKQESNGTLSRPDGKRVININRPPGFR